MKNARRIYTLLLQLYPSSYRQAFRTEMMQTFLDHHLDIQMSEGHVGLRFWIATVTDELQNILRQQMTSLVEDRPLLKVAASRIAVFAMFVFPLFAVLYAGLIRVALMLPHPHVGALGFLLALVALLLIPGIVSIVVSFALANALVSLFARHKIKAA